MLPSFKQRGRQWHPTLILLPGEIPWMEEPGRLQFMRSLRVGHNWATSLSLFTFMHWRRKWQLTPVFLPGETQGRGCLVGLHRVGHDWSNLVAATATLNSLPGPPLLYYCFTFFLIFTTSRNYLVRLLVYFFTIMWALWESDDILPIFSSVQFSSVAKSCPTLCDSMNCSMPGLPVHHQLLEFTQTHLHRVGDAIQPSHPPSSPFPPARNPSQYQSLFQWVNSLHEVAKVLEFQL